MAGCCQVTGTTLAIHWRPTGTALATCSQLTVFFQVLSIVSFEVTSDSAGQFPMLPEVPVDPLLDQNLAYMPWLRHCHRANGRTGWNASPAREVEGTVERDLVCLVWPSDLFL